MICSGNFIQGDDWSNRKCVRIIKVFYFRVVIVAAVAVIVFCCCCHSPESASVLLK